MNQIAVYVSDQICVEDVEKILSAEQLGIGRFYCEVGLNCAECGYTGIIVQSLYVEIIFVEIGEETVI